MAIETISGEIASQPLNDNFSFLQSKLNTVSYDVKNDFTADSTGVLNSSVAFNAAISACISVSGGNLVVPPGTYVFTSNVTFSSSVTLFPIKGAMLYPATGCTMTFNNYVDCGNYKFLSNTAGGTIAGTILNRTVNPKWVCNADNTDDGSNINTILTLANEKPVEFPEGIYNVASMTAVDGKITLIGDSENVKIIGFQYTENSAPTQNYQSTSEYTDAEFQAYGLNFEGDSVTAGLTIHNQSQTSVIKSFSIHDCTFYGEIGLITQNCGQSIISHCNFMNNIYGWKSQSCTNMSVIDSQWFAPTGIGVLIETSGDDTANREGGENIKFTNCTWIDGVTAIKAVKHNYLWLVNCLIDYFNCGIYIEGGRYASLNDTYIGHDHTDRSGHADYVVPPAFGCLYMVPNAAASRSAGIECINAEFAGYASTTSAIVTLDGSASVPTFNGVEESTFIGCRFGIDASAGSPYLLYINYAQDIYHVGNRYYANYNEDVTEPWLFENITRGRSERNNYTNCLDSAGATVQPTTFATGNEFFECSQISLATNGTATTDSNNYTFKNTYAAAPYVIATAKVGILSTPTEKLNVGIDSYDTTTAYVKACHIDNTNMSSGQTILVDIFVIGT